MLEKESIYLINETIELPNLTITSYSDEDREGDAYIVN